MGRAYLKIPKALIIFGKLLRVKLLDLSAVKTEGGQPAGGYCDGDEIVIDSATKRSDYDRIILHEMIHAILYRTEICALISDDLNEQITSQITLSVLENFELRTRKYLLDMHVPEPKHPSQKDEVPQKKQPQRRRK